MYIIALSGTKRSGKDTIAVIIKDILVGRLVERYAFADSLKEEVSRATGYSTVRMDDLKEVFRPLYQWWGTEFRRQLHGEDYWIRRLLTKLVASKAYCVVITDVRFRNEADSIRNVGGYVFRIRRPSQHSNDPHQSENDLTDTNYPYTGYLDNSGTLDDLRKETNKLIRLYGLKPMTEVKVLSSK